MNGDDAILLDIFLPEGARARDVVCEVVNGFLHVSLTDSELLSGRLALTVDRTELMWGVEDEDDGRRLLCIELPLAPADPSNTVRVDSVFSSLAIRGSQCLALGLSHE